MQLVWTDAAISDLISIRAYIERENPSAAERVTSSILHAVEKLEGNSMIGRKGRVVGTRELVITKYPYIIPYRVRGETVEFLRVMHCRQDWPEAL